MKKIAKRLARSGVKPEKEAVTPLNVSEIPPTPSVGGKDSKAISAREIGIASNQPNQTRLENALQKLFDASAELNESLRVYNVENGSWDLIELGPDISPSNIATTVENVLVHQRNQSPGVASKVGSFLGRIYPLASLVLGLSAAASEGASFMPIKGAINSLTLLYSIAEQERTKSEDFLQQLERISYQALRVKEVQSMQNVNIGDLLLEKSSNLMTNILQFLNSAVLFFRHEFFYNLGRTVLLGPKVYADGKAALNQAIAEYDQALLLEVTIKILTLTAPTAAALGPSDQEKLNVLLSWLGSSAFEVEAQYVNNCEARAPGTLQWVLECEEFKSWRLQEDGSGQKSSLWLNGVPGVGKSVIAAYLVQILKAQHPDSIVLSFFCKAGESSLDRLDSVVRTLASQLAQMDETCRDHLQKLKDGGYQPSKSLSSLFDNVMRDIIKEVSRPIFIVIDGLDECFDIDPNDGDNTIKRLLEGFESLNVQLLISSRPTPEITRALYFRHKKTLTFEDSRDDIEKYVLMRVSKSKNLQRGFSRISKEPGKYFAEKSNGNFLWARIVMDLLERTPSAKAFQTAIEAIPRALEGVYDKVLDRLELAGTLEAAMAILECVLFSARPMTIEELHIATALMFDEILDLEGFVEADCGSFLAVAPEKNGKSVTIVHETFRSYITSVKATSSRRLIPSRSHARIATICLETLTEVGRDGDEAQMKIDLECFQGYATDHWQLSLKDSLDSTSAMDVECTLGLLIALHNFLCNSSSVRAWMQRYIILKENHHDAWQLGMLMANMHDEVLNWINSEGVSLSLNESAKQRTALECPRHISEWRTEVCKPASTVLAANLSDNFTWVWLNTYWKNYKLAKFVFVGALRMARIFQLAGEPLEEEDSARIKWLPGFGPIISPEQKSRPGWTWRNPSSISSQWRVGPEQLAAVAARAGYDGSVGVQAGNYAIGEHRANSAHCVQSFRIAIDENPERWHLYEGLGNWYGLQKDDENALKYYRQAMTLDPEKPPGCAENYFTLLAEVKTREKDLPAAEDAFRQGGLMHKTWYGNVYWNRMAKLYEEIEDWENVKRVRREAIEKHPVCAMVYWEALAEAYKPALDWRGNLEVLLEAIEKDPENASRYEDQIKNLGTEFKDLQMWEPAVDIFIAAREKHPSGTYTYNHELAGVYLAHGGRDNWAKVSKLLESILETQPDGVHTREYDELATCYLGLGEFSKCQAALQLSVLQGVADNVGPAYIVAGEYPKAIQALRAEIRWRLDHSKEYPQDQYRAHQLLRLYMNLGLCYEALGRDEDAQNSFAAAVKCFEKYAPEQKDDALNKEDGRSYHRCDARPLYEFGLTLEKLDRLQQAQEYYYAAEFTCRVTTFVDDDEVLTSEAAEIQEALERVTKALAVEEEGNKEENLGWRQDEGEVEKKPNKSEMPDLLERLGGIRLQRRLCFQYRTNWSAYRESKNPKPRGSGTGYGKLLYEKYGVTI